MVAKRQPKKQATNHLIFLPSQYDWQGKTKQKRKKTEQEFELGLLLTHANANAKQMQ